MCELYLEVSRKTEDDYCHVSVYSAITLFIFKFCQIGQRLTLHFVTVRLF